MADFSDPPVIQLVVVAVLESKCWPVSLNLDKDLGLETQYWPDFHVHRVVLQSLLLTFRCTQLGYLESSLSQLGG